MAARTFTSAGVNNLWSNVANWDGGIAVPANGDSVTIPTGQTCIFDYDTSGYADGIAGITITGTLSVSTTTTSYLKMKAATTISGAGTFNVGTSGTPIPFAVKFTLTGGSGWYVQGSGGLTMGVYGAEPTYTYAKLSGAESAGATRLEIDTDLTGDIWANADAIRINNVNKAKDSELRVIGAITSTYIDITAGLTASKIIGSYVCLITRNITITGLGANLLQNFASGKLIIAGGSFVTDFRDILRACINATINGGVYSASENAINNSSGVVVNGGVFVSNSYAIYNSQSAIINNVNMFSHNYCFGANSKVIINNGIFAGNLNITINFLDILVYGGSFIGNNFCFERSSYILIAGGSFIGNNTITNLVNNIQITGGSFVSNSGAIFYTSATITGATFTGNTYDIRESQFTAYNQTLTSSPDNYLYGNLSRNIYSESINHNNTAGAFKAWTKGGITTSVATPVPTGFTRSYQLALESATVEGFFNKRVNVPAGKTINLTLHLRKNASMTYLPRVWVHILGTEPFTTAGDILHTFTMTNSTDTWESDTYSYTNTADYDVELNCRFVAMNATGYVYGQVLDSLGGGVSRARILGGM